MNNLYNSDFEKNFNVTIVSLDIKKNHINNNCNIDDNIKFML